MQYSTNLHIRIKEQKYKEKVDKVLERYQVIGNWNNKDFISDFELSISNNILKELIVELNNIFKNNSIVFGTNTSLSTDSKGYLIYSVDTINEIYLDTVDGIDIYNLEECFCFISKFKNLTLKQEKYLKKFDIFKSKKEVNLYYEPQIRTIDAYDADTIPVIGSKLLLEVSSDKDSIYLVDESDNYYGTIMIEKIEDNHHIIDYDLEFINYTDKLVAVVITGVKSFMNGKGFDVAIFDKESSTIDEYLKNNSIESSNYEYYVDVKFDGASISYTYISPKNRALNTGDKIKVRSYDSIKEVIVTKGTYKLKRKTDYEYKELEVIE